MPDRAELARHYRRRAEEVRTIAQGLFDEGERKTLMDVADDYENWALLVDVNSRAGTA